MNGKVTNEKWEDDFDRATKLAALAGSYLKTITEHCEVLYLFEGRMSARDRINAHEIVFLDTLEEAKRLIGKTVWMNEAPKGVPRNFLGGETKDYRVPYHNIERMKVVGIDTTRYGHTYGIGPFYLVLENSKGQRGIKKYNKEYIFTEKPYPDTWGNAVLEAIREGKVFIGMTSDQVRLSWGEPGGINQSIGRWGVHEQWVYRAGYLYFENGKLTSIQTLR